MSDKFNPSAAILGQSKRKFLKTTMLGAAAASILPLAMPNVARGAKAKIAVIGGGIAGGTVAHYLAKGYNDALDITVIEPNRNYTTCFFSNLYLGGLRSYDSLIHGYDKLTDLGVKFAHMRAYSADTDKKTVRLAQGNNIAYDRLVVTPGISFDYGAYEGYSEAVSMMHPHAYRGDPGVVKLKQQLHAMEDGGTFIMLAPPNPYRCPPGPYERVSMVAHYFSQYKPKSKILILDTKNKFSKQGLFTEGWNKHYPGMVEWLSSDLVGDIERIDANNNVIIADGESYKGDVLNIIPPQRAGSIASTIGIADQSGWCPINSATSFESSLASNVHVLGDSSINGAMPKSGFSANSQAKMVAMSIAHDLAGGPQYPARFRNTCWSLITEGDSIKVGANYVADGSKTVSKDPFVSQTGEDETVRLQNEQEAYGWYDAITADVFG